VSVARGRPRRQYAVRRIRLVNFHNFVDETIEVRDGGHLFLLGDNGAGKTTVLDALQYALSGGVGLELNAAARVGGRRDEGRSLQGIVLRYDTERGLLNEGGAVSYAVVEAVGDDGQPLCFGMGAEATTLEARVTRWGLIKRGALEELPLLGVDRSPLTRDQLRDQLGKEACFGRIEDYRRALAEQLFGSPALYEEVCRFWSMAKAYREIVAGARDFGVLFARLLPGIEPEIFGEIVRSLRAIDELEVTLSAIDQQRGYVSDLMALIEEVRKQREAIARYRWLILQRSLDEGAVMVADADREGALLAEQVATLEAQVDAGRARLAASEDALRAASAGEAFDVLRELRSAEAASRERSAEARTLVVEARSGEARAQRAGEGFRRARHELAEVLRSLGEALFEAIDAVVMLPGQLGRVRAEATRAIEQAAGLATEVVPEQLVPTAAAALEELAARVATARGELLARGRESDRARRADDEARVEVARLEGAEEEAPSVPGFSLALAALARDGLRAEPLYRLLLPREDAPPEQLAALEELAGEPTLAALVAEPELVERVRICVLEAAPGIRVVTRVALEVALPAWLAGLLEPGAGLQETATAALATALSQPASLGELLPPDSTGVVELRGVTARGAARAPRLIGAPARRRAHALRLEAAREALASSTLRLASAERDERAAEQALARLALVADRLAALSGAALVARHAEALRARQVLELEQATATQSGRQAAAAAERAIHAAAFVEALQARLDGNTVAELEARLARLRELAEAARTSHLHLMGEHADARASLKQARERAGRLVSEQAGLREQLIVAAQQLRSHLPTTMDDDALERYVRVDQRGSQFRTTAAVQERLREAERVEQSAADEVGGDGSRGVRNLRYAGQFGFSYDRSANRIADRRGQAASGILAQLEHDLAEQRGLVNDRTRQLMDTVVMGTLARQLQDHVEQLQRTVRDISRLLGGLTFGRTQYQFVVTPRADRKELVEMVRSISILNEESRRQFRAWIDERMGELKQVGDDGVPDVLDYRLWFDYRLRMRSAGSEGVELTRELRTLGSGGEQGVPNYLLVLALAKLMFDNAEARLRPVLFDEAFYGIDAGRRDQLLRFATELGLQLFVASPDQDGVSAAVQHATTLFVVKDANCDVHLAPYHYWNRSSIAQTSLFDSTPVEPPPESAECRVAPAPPLPGATE